MSKSINNSYAIIAITACLFLIVFSRDCMNAALTGFDIWLTFVMPSIFPFFVCISFMRESGLLSVRSGHFTVPLFVSCALSGAPSGSRLCAHLADYSVIEYTKLSEYCAVCNMVSPIFITGTLVAMYGSTAIALPVLIGHYLSAFLVLSYINRNNKCVKQNLNHKSELSFFNVLCRAISDGVRAAIQICGVIIIFTVILSMLLKLSSLLGINTLNPIYLCIMSLIEMTNGAGMILASNFSYPITCAVLSFSISFGGLCVMIQAAQLAQIEPKKYLLTKLFTACIAGMVSFISAILIPVSAPVFSQAGEAVGQITEGSVSLGIIALSSLIGCAFIWLLSTARPRDKHS